MKRERKQNKTISLHTIVVQLYKATIHIASEILSKEPHQVNLQFGCVRRNSERNLAKLGPGAAHHSALAAAVGGAALLHAKAACLVAWGNEAKECNAPPEFLLV